MRLNLFPNLYYLFNLQQASLRVWDEERGQDENSRRDKPVVPNKVIIFSSHLTDADHIEKYLQKDRSVRINSISIAKHAH